MNRYPLIAALILTFSIATEAGPLRHRLELQSEALPGTPRSRVLPGPGEVVIELEGTPLILRDPSVRGAASAELDVLFERLERDLARIGREIPARAAKGESTPAPRILHRYRLAFAGASVHVDPAAIERISNLDYVRRVHPDWISTAYLSESTTVVGAPQFWSDYGSRGAGAVVAILDSGIDYEHPALGGGFGPGFKVRGGRDFVNNDADPMDDHGHGTHVAGIVAADGGGLVGVAPDATLLAYKVLDASGSGRDSWILAAIERAIQDGAHVVNMSLGRPATANDPVTSSVETAFAGGMLFAVAAGNSGRFLDIGTPGNAPSAITVGATDNSGRIAGFSSKGPVVPSGSIKPELVAPGVAIISAAPGGGTHTASGTSMAAPHVAGVAALLRSIHPDWSAEAIRSTLIGSARPVDAEVMARGAGIIHAVDAAAARVFPSENVLAFGIADPAGGLWTASRTLTLVNGSSEAKTVSVEIDGLRDGIALTPSVSTLALEPGALTQLVLELTLDPANVPAPEAGSLSFGGSIRLTDGSSSYSIPWGFVLASKIRVQWSGPETATVRVGTARMMIEGWTGTGQPAELFIGAGAASLWVSSGFPFGSVVRHVIIEDLDFSTQSDLTLGPDDAPHRIAFAGADAHGRLLSDRAGLSLKELAVRHPHFESRLLDIVTSLTSDQQIFFSDLNGETRLIGFERAFDFQPSITWVAQYEPIEELTSDIDLTLDPEDWTPLSIRGVVPADLEQPYQSVAAGAWIVAGSGTVGSVAEPAVDGAAYEPGTEVRAWVTRSALEGSRTSILFEIGEVPPGEGTPSRDLFAEFTGTDQGIIPGHSARPRLSDRVIQPGDPIVIGGGPVHPISIIGPGPGAVFATVQWLGPHGEERPYDAKRMTGRIYDSEGTLIASGQAPPRYSTGFPSVFQMIAPLEVVGSYRFEAVNRSFEIAGAGAEATLTSTFDLGRDDAAPPAITSLSIGDGSGRVSSTLPTGSASTLTFSAVDLATFAFGEVRSERTVVEVRTHGSGGAAPWVALNAVEVGEDFTTPPGLGRPPDGILYRVDLAGITSSLIGAVDLKISLEDPSGNSTVYVLEPAFVVRGGRGRTVARQ